jgi:hypothetical protein
MNTKLTALLATLCMSASVFAQTAPTTPPNNGVNNSLPNANAQLGQPATRAADQAAMQQHQNSTPQQTREQVKMANAQRTKDVNCVDGGVATPPAQTAAHAGKHDNQLAKADCVRPTTQR